ncbi:MAG: carbamate kinase [candidate division Zixibacteria bacterium]|nr:carbamate kinase [candidate division Zixibacteria bacterium]
MGGNALAREDEDGTFDEQYRRAIAMAESLRWMIVDGWRLVIVHGNGPQVGNALLRVESAAGKAPILPLGICVADTEGGMGYMIEQCLQNELHFAGHDREVVTIVTQMLVDKSDPAFENPTKYIGQFYSEEESKKLARVRKWQMKKDGERGWRRVVASPAPLGAVCAGIIKRLVEEDVIVIAAGGGGVPVYHDDHRLLEGIDAVIDKDLAAAVVAKEIGADTLLILTDVQKVALNFGKENQQDLDHISAKQAQEYFDQGHFPKGSMGPKIRAAISFLNSGGKCVIIASVEQASEALAGNAGTRIIP